MKKRLMIISFTIIFIILYIGIQYKVKHIKNEVNDEVIEKNLNENQSVSERFVVDGDDGEEEKYRLIDENGVTIIEGIDASMIELYKEHPDFDPSF